MAITCVAVAALHPVQADELPNDLPIVPGERIGPLKLPASEADVMRVFAGHAARSAFEIVEGNGPATGTILFPCDPARQAYVFYEATLVGRRTSEPSSASRRMVTEIDVPAPSLQAQAACQQASVFAKVHRHAGPVMFTISDYFWLGQTSADIMVDEGLLPRSRKEWMRKVPSRWHLANGLRPGMTVSSLQRLNGRVFDLHGPEGDLTGGVSNWRGGKLDGKGWSAAVDGATQADDTGVAYTSDDPALQGEACWVYMLYVELPPSGGQPAPQGSLK